MSISQIEYFWEHGIYSIEKMCSLVDRKIITEQEFHEITRKYYKAIMQKRGYSI